MSTKKKAKFQSWFKREVNVTSKHLTKAHKLRGEDRKKECPVALGLRGLKLRKVEVNTADAKVTVKGKVYRAELPKRVQNFIAAFDKSKESAAKLKPITFKLKFIAVKLKFIAVEED
jgi:hypothetical protein